MVGFRANPDVDRAVPTENKRSHVAENRGVGEAGDLVHVQAGASGSDRIDPQGEGWARHDHPVEDVDHAVHVLHHAGDLPGLRLQHGLRKRLQCLLERARASTVDEHEHVLGTLERRVERSLRDEDGGQDRVEPRRRVDTAHLEFEPLSPRRLQAERAADAEAVVVRELALEDSAAGTELREGTALPVEAHHPGDRLRVRVAVGAAVRAGGDAGDDQA